MQLAPRAEGDQTPLAAAGSNGGWDRSGTSRLLRRLMVAVIVVPVTLYLAAAWLNYQAAFDAARVRRDVVPLRSAAGSETILVVEDDEAVLATAVESLEDLGYQVLVAHNGREALDIVNGSAKIDILFSDIVMPGGINGAELTAEARRLRPSIKVLLTSGYTGAMLAGEHGLPADLPVLGKPYRRDELAAQLRVIVGGQAR
jgi:CheY-like chemotaxis protein